MEQLSTEELTTAFSRLYAHQPEEIWAAPGRVNLIGEHTDYNYGYVLPLALPQATVAAVARRNDGRIRVTSLNTDETVEVTEQQQKPGGVTGWAAYAVGVFWALREAGYPIGGADVLISTDIPQGAGLSSSAALELSVAGAVAALDGHRIEPLALAQLAQRAENEYVGMPCGLMDQMVSMLGEEGHLVLFDTLSLEPRPVPFNLPRTSLLVVDTRAPHQLVDGEYAARRAQCEQAAHLLGLEHLREINDKQLPLDEVLQRLEDEVLQKRTRHVVTENQRVLETVQALTAGDPSRAGELMNASHRSLRDDYEVSVPEVDLAQQTLVDHGAYGARITGGGFGGCVVALVRDTAAAGLQEAVGNAYAQAGYTAPESFIAVPSAGARRVSV